MEDIGDKVWYGGETRIRAFIDSDFPPDFGKTAMAFPPIPKDKGRELFGHLKLA